jgi:hypothetical protein
VSVRVCVCACVCLSAAQQTNDSENGSEPAGTNYSIGHVGLHAMPFNGDLVNHHFGNRIRFNSLTLREIFNLPVFLNLKCLPCGKKRSETVRNGQKRPETDGHVAFSEVFSAKLTKCVLFCFVFWVCFVG